jgi:hypothetical protein
MTKTRDLADLANGITSANIVDGAVTNADINSSAAVTSSKLAFTQSGTGAQQRTVESKLRDVVSVKDFGVIGDGSDETTKIQAAINATPVGGTLIVNTGTYVTGNYLTINKSINIDFRGSTINSTAPGFIFSIASSLDIANKVTYAPAIVKGQQTIPVAPPVGTTVGSYLWLEYGTQPTDVQEQHYTEFVRVLAVSPSSFTVDWAPPEDVNYSGNPRTNYFTLVTSLAKDITIKNIITNDVNASIDGIFRVAGTINVTIENHTHNNGICGLRFQDSKNITYRNVRSSNTHLVLAGWSSENLVLENCYWQAKKSPLILNDPSCIGNESEVVNLKVRNVECYIPSSETVTNVFDFSTDSKNCSIINAKITGEFTNLTSTFLNSEKEITLSNIQVFDNQNGYNVPQLNSGKLESLYDDDLGQFYIQGDTYEETLTIPFYGTIGPIIFAQGLLSDVWLYCTNWSLVSSLLIRNSTGSGFNSSSYTGSLTNNQWVRVTPAFIASIGTGINNDYGTKDYILNLLSTSPSDYIKIRYRASRNTNGAFARPGRTTEEASTIGTFTPQLISSNGDLIASTTSGFVANYVKTGRLINFSIYSTFNVTTAGTGNVLVTGFPFRLSTFSVLNISSFRFVTSAPISAILDANSANIALYTSIGDTSGSSSTPPLTTANLTVSNAFANGMLITGTGISV